MITDEQELVNLAKLGDNAAFHELYWLNKERIFHLAFQYTQNYQDAEDLLQETFSRAFLAIAKFKAEKNARFSTWLFRIGVNCAINFVKRRKEHLSRTVGAETLGVESMAQQAGGVHNNPEENLVLEEMHGQLEIGLATLSPNQRMIFVLKHYQGLKIKEIADYMSCSEGSVKKQLSRAIETLMEILTVVPQENSYELQKNKKLDLSIFLQ